ncbi:germination protein YpeB [Salsuginibacillus kocurii]|uniref:germination protein YpeB n=1 Tax=Salsuginibacillus kocurii TaxID=427078 RepID=UPI00036C84FB|nr:germination protein YpeB [Salsuginibacillus kocurii]
MIRYVIIGALSILLIATGWIAIQENNQKNAYAMQQENNYYRAFNDFAYHVDQLEDELSQALAMNNPESLSGSLSDVWRVTAQANSEMGQLPLGMIPVEETEQFLHQVGDFSYQAAVKDRDGGELDEDEEEKLEQYHKQAKELKHEIRELQAKALDEEISWLELEEELVAAKQPGEGTMVDGMTEIDEKVKGYSEADAGPDHPFGGEEETDLAEVIEDEEPVSEEEAIDRALNLLNLPDETPAKASELGEGSDYEGYQIEIADPQGEPNYMVEMTKRGGHPVWFMQDRPINEPEISLHEGSEQAKQFLEDAGVEDMDLVDSKQYDTIGLYKFVPVEDEVRLYTDEITIETALDDGDIVAMQALDYLTNHNNRDDFDTDPELSEDEARESVKKQVDIKETHLALTESEKGEEVLCYEFYGVRGDDSYRIYINAESGEEERVDKLPEAEPVYDVD